MKAFNDKEKLEQLIRHATPEDMPEPDFKAWAERHGDDIEALQSPTGKKASVKFNRGFYRLFRVAAVVFLFLGLGYIAGRWSGPPHPDIAGLRAELEQSYRAGYEQLRQDILQQLHVDMVDLAQQAVVVSKQITDQQMAALVCEIDEIRLRDRQYVATAFAQVEKNRMRTMAQLGQGLNRLATQEGRLEQN